MQSVLRGFTNIGGALLSVYAAAVHKEKPEIRGTVATYYLAFGVVQIATIALLKPDALGAHSLLSAVIATIVYCLVGRIIFQRASGKAYDKAITGFIAIYGLAVLVKASL